MLKQAVVIIAFLSSSMLFAQSTQMEGTIKGRVGKYLIMSPAQYDESTFPEAEQSVKLYLFVNEDLPEGKTPGYFEIFDMTYVEAIPSLKQLRFTTTGDVEAIRNQLGIESIELKPGNKIKLVW